MPAAHTAPSYSGRIPARKDLADQSSLRRSRLFCSVFRSHQLYKELVLTRSSSCSNRHFFPIRKLDLLVWQFGCFNTMERRDKPGQILIQRSIHVPSIWSRIAFVQFFGRQWILVERCMVLHNMSLSPSLRVIAANSRHASGPNHGSLHGHSCSRCR